MAPKHRKALLIGFSGIVLLLMASALSPAASAANYVDLSFKFRAGESSACRPWTGSGQLQWNFTLAQNGTDASLITTPTYVYIEDATILGPRADGWLFILSASNSGNTTKAFEEQSSNNFAQADGAYSPPSTGTLDLALYSGGHLPPAPPANITVFLLPKLESENKTWYFNITAKTHDRSGLVPDIVKKIPLCATIPANPKFDMGNETTVPIQAAANSTVNVNFWIKNTGNTQDFFICNVSVPRDDWAWNFLKGFVKAGGQNVTNYTAPKQNISVQVSVFVPPTAKARENSTVSLNCVSFKALTLNRTVFVYPPYVKVEVIQFYYVCGAIVGDSLKAGVPGDQLRFDMIVRNLGNGPDQGVAKIVVGNLGWDVIVTPETFAFPKGQGETGWELTAQFVATIPNHTFVGTYDYTVNVTSIVPLTPVCPLRYHVQVKQVYVPLVTQPVYQTGGPGLQIDFSFGIKNGGNFDDEFSIEVFNIPDWRVFLDPPIGRKLLHSDQEANFTASVLVPASLLKAQVGQYNQTVRVTSLYAREDIGQTISVELNLTVIILPKINCAVDPPSTDWELNPFAFPNGIGKGNFLLEFTNTGNGGDSLNISSSGPELVNVTLSPSILHLQVLEIKAVLVTMEFPSVLSRGSYDISIVGRSQLNSSATCTSTYHVTIVNMNGRLNPVPQGAVQDPENPEGDIPPPQPLPGPIDQVEGFLVNVRILFENVGDRAIASGSATVNIYDELDCPRAPVRAAQDTCGSRPLFTWTLNVNLITGTTGNSVFVNYLYTAPDWLCFEEAICESDPPVGNIHHIKFVLVLGKESTNADNEVVAMVNVLPKRLIETPPPPAGFPIIPAVAGALVAGLAGFFVWYNYLRTPKVDEELYASIYGEQGGEAAAAPAAAAPKPPGPVQKQSDAQTEEGKRLYGDSYGKPKR